MGRKMTLHSKWQVYCPVTYQGSLCCLGGESRGGKKCMKGIKEMNEGTKYESTDMTVEFPTGFSATVN
jgi:hypothetical protein